MGYAYQSLQPIVLASKLTRALKLSKGGEETNLGKVAPNRDNCLIIDNNVTYVNDEIVHDVSLKLLNVESEKRRQTVQCNLRRRTSKDAICERIYKEEQFDK
ncbi:hypothetical protein KSP39_PZI006121 [Platanthera zijinensis]|uniref:Uncharacterized protein n=1 Tax=Platanthera zijinensis TaxID=2320716 RepID=A0AAP0BUP4_9ASPA